ncbi:MAG: protein phosphatase 2C domain-containing protein [Pseudomonadales bacterium]|nr:protein phosphatase 2C domain-containing protein [Pseudomonadales bacterium]
MITYSLSTHPGCKHELNEDTIGESASDSLWLVADGMGGHAAGEVASLIAKNTVLADVATGATLNDAVLNAHSAVLDAANSKPDQAGMGTTMVAARLEGYVAELVWVGDSRAYLWRDGVLQAVTTDHSFMQLLIANQQLTPEEAHKHPKRNIVTQVLGVGEPKPDRVTLRLQCQDWILLCSDGLNDELMDDEIAMVLRDSTDTNSAVTRLIDAACTSGGRDNVSAIVIQYDGESAPVNDPTTIRRSVSESLFPLEENASLVGRSLKFARSPVFWGGVAALILGSILWYLRGGI